MQIRHERVARTEWDRTPKKVECDVEKKISGARHDQVRVANRRLDLVEIRSIVTEVESAEPFSGGFLPTLVFEIRNEAGAGCLLHHRIGVPSDDDEVELNVRIESPQAVSHHQ